jgi:hypothetical protein
MIEVVVVLQELLYCKIVQMVEKGLAEQYITFICKYCSLILNDDIIVGIRVLFALGLAHVERVTQLGKASASLSSHKAPKSQRVPATTKRICPSPIGKVCASLV